MNLSGLLPLLQNIPTYQGLLKASGRQKVTILDAAKPLLVASLYHDLRVPVMVITPNPEEAKRLYDELMAWCRPDAPVHLFPQMDVLAYERLTPDPSTVQQRLRVMALLKDQKSPRPLIVASAYSVSQKTIPVESFVTLAIKAGERIDFNQLLSRLTTMGYEMTAVVEKSGEASRRGGIIDIYSSNHEHPGRIEFVGSQVESIRWFDPATQRSVGKTQSLVIIPARELIPPVTRAIQTAFDGLDVTDCSNETRDAIREDVELLTQGQWRDGLEFYAPLFDSGSIIDYLPRNSLIIMEDTQNIAAELGDLETEADQLRQGQIQRGELPRNFPLPYFPWNDLEKRISGTERSLLLQQWELEDGGEPLGFGAVSGYGGKISNFIDKSSEGFRAGKRLVVISQQADRLAQLMAECGFSAGAVEQVGALPPAPSLTLIHGSLSGGWILEETWLITDNELFGFSKKRRPIPQRHAQHEAFLADLEVGDYVVHIDHGIARFSGMIKMSPNGVEREYLMLEYAEDDKLYVPTDQVDRVVRYVGSGGYVPALSRLNTQEWDRTKERVKNATRDMAEELLAIYAAREVSQGIAFEPDSPWERQLEASFPYIETPDQFKAIHEVKQDMESPKPMDRLVCGDVGYGKTEIAVRAAFKAVVNGMQVAVLVPTTVLAQQHYTTFSQRLAAFPMKVEMLSRFRSPKEQQKVIEGLAAGSVDICIGTHRLLQSDVVFHNLGLIIIDEEQKFGVGHKEKLKKLRREVDVLTITATPIPRTLHMALVGARDMSTIETAPEDRLPIKTYVGEYDPQIVRSAILRELERKGQVFFVHNRVQSIGWVAEQLRELVPEAKIVVGHGQMQEEVLESVMFEFSSGKFNVLVCTTIIESGLDLPAANTLIINQADKLGLTQLYHLRGRVGRSDVRAYAYLFYDKEKRLTELAQKRLKTIFEATELGSGFRIALKDLEIRGAGNILGAEQSGHVGAVGFDLYCRLLAQAVEELKAGGGEPVQRPELAVVDLPITAYIPEEYVSDLTARLALYHRLSRIDSIEQVTDIHQELKDRFGKVPEPVENLLSGIRIRLLASRAGVQKVFTEGGQIIIAIADDRGIDRNSLQRRFGSSIKVGSTQIRLEVRKLGKFWMRILEEVLRTMRK